MKKAFTLVVLIITPTMAFAQGQITFANQTGLVKQWTSPTDQTLVNSVKGNVMVELISAPVGTPLVAPLVDPCGCAVYSSLASFLVANPGWAPGVGIQGGQNPGGLAVNGIFANGTLSLNVPGRTAAQYFVISWTGANGGALGTATTFDTAAALGSCMFGESPIFTTQTGDPTAIPPDLPVSTKTTFGGMSLMPIPEPSTFALAGLGALTGMLFRRRRQFPF